MPLKILFEYDVTSDLFEATLENGARFTFKRTDIEGKLANNLELYRRAVISLIEDKGTFRVSSKLKDREELIRLSAGKSVQVVGKRKKVSLDDLVINLKEP